MKAALKARLQGPNWADELPWVLLGLRTAPKEDLGFSTAELVYGTPLTVPGEFIDLSSKFRPVCTPNDLFYTKLKNLSPFATAHHKLSSPSAVPQSLRDAKFVFIRHDGHRGPFQRPYNGPFRVITSGDKTFCIMVGGREEIISVDRLKPAHVDLTGPVTVAQPPRHGRPPLQPPEPAPQERVLVPENTSARPESRLTRSGRTVRLPSPHVSTDHNASAGGSSVASHSRHYHNRTDTGHCYTHIASIFRLLSARGLLVLFTFLTGTHTSRDR